MDFTECANLVNDAVAQELLIQVEGRGIAELILEDCKTIEDDLSNDLKYKGEINRNRGCP